MCFQWLFDVVIELFEQVGLRENVVNMVAMVCQPGPIVVRNSTPAYGRQITGEGNSRQLRQRRWFVFTKCGADLVADFLDAHMEMKHFRSGCATAETAPALLPDHPVDYQM